MTVGPPNADDSAFCPGDHRGAPGFCPNCGAPLEVSPEPEGRRRWWHSTARRAAVVATIVAVAVGLAVLIVVVDARRSADHMAPSEQAAVRQWWSTAQPAITDLQEALYDSESSLRRMNASALASACQRMHDGAAVDVPAQLPSPDRDLTAELTAAAEDAHTAAHMCLAVVAKSPHNYEGEFTANLDQAEKQMRAAMTLVNRILTAQTPGERLGSARDRAVAEG
ncbi:hypothetical protein [Mycolicibacterium monacense]|uniref:Uncharacterized protein n=3 Tax=Mycobacteriaceae TaxID=1762 RepID=A0AAD1IY36_MYCMB|nr:hypothetical protein [Mycolicibacterium monacense]MDA4101342.1 hypothetical protein [Mycolicibacterium monacense DSM 44395]OBF56078.1 hypothetical protein A5778_07615 [Mycolicibacterium monacense]ORB20802.1 hypothetical protein BST34_11380 [Mycolicibacterium monacense DSM 44395]QHP84934.1 hypothetical protein EWR22_05870 [Mycolicibacterium monacense DSM 44395]BBZ62248.1 hypothetical protein MMON_35490 [Mycolicibacterium monacense]